MVRDMERSTTVGKLVRDEIPAIIKAKGEIPCTRILDPETHRTALFDKLVEEAQELRDAPPERRLEEAADVYEVLRALLTELGVTLGDVAASAAAKRETRGGFEGRIWLD